MNVEHNEIAKAIINLVSETIKEIIVTTKIPDIENPGETVTYWMRPYFRDVKIGLAGRTFGDTMTAAKTYDFIVALVGCTTGTVIKVVEKETEAEESKVENKAI